MSGGMHCKGANPDNCCYHERCREKTLSDFPFVLFHNLRLKGNVLIVKKKNLAAHVYVFRF